MASVALLWFVSMYSIFFSVFWLNLYFSRGKKEITRNPLKSFPKVSVIIPAYNEEKKIAECIESLLNMDYQKNKLEIIVVDDGSTDGTAKVAAGFEPRGIVLVKKKNGGKGSALNAGLAKASGEFVACMDADSITEKDTLKKLLSGFSDEKVAAVTPAMKVYRPKNLLQRLQGMEYVLAILLRKLMSDIDTMQVTPGPFSVYRKSILDEIGHFDEKSLVEDTEIAYRIHYHKYKIKNVADAYVYTYCPQTLGSLKNQRIRWYRGLYRTLVQYKEMILNPRYGNFSMFHLPTMTLSVVLMFLALFLYISTFFEYLTLQANILTLVGPGYYVPVWSELFRFNSVLSVNLLSWFPIIATFVTGFYVLRLAYKISRERLRDSIVYLLPGILFYYSILTVFWIMALSKEWSGARSRW